MKIIMAIREFILNNFLIKILSIAFAIILWFFVTSKGKIEVNFNVPLEFRKIPSSFVIVGDVNEYIDVRLKGRDSAIGGLSAGQISAHLDLSDAKPGDNIVYLSPENIVVPPNIEVMRINPKAVKLRLEPLIRREVRVMPETIGMPGKGYSVKEIEVSPLTVTVEGAESVINKLSSVKTEVISLSGIDKRETLLDVKLNLYGRDVKIINRGYVKVRIILTR